MLNRDSDCLPQPLTDTMSRLFTCMLENEHNEHNYMGHPQVVHYDLWCACACATPSLSTISTFHFIHYPSSLFGGPCLALYSDEVMRQCSLLPCTSLTTTKGTVTSLQPPRACAPQWRHQWDCKNVVFRRHRTKPCTLGKDHSSDGDNATYPRSPLPCMPLAMTMTKDGEALHCCP